MIDMIISCIVLVLTLSIILEIAFCVVLPWFNKRDGNEHLNRKKNTAYNENTSKKE